MNLTKCEKVLEKRQGTTREKYDTHNNNYEIISDDDMMMIDDGR